MTIASAALPFLAGWTAFSILCGTAFAIIRIRVKNNQAKAVERVEPQSVVDARWAYPRRVS